jgi:hypothetical protein
MSDNLKYRVFPKEVDIKPIPQADSIPLESVVAFGACVWLGVSGGLDRGSSVLIGVLAAVVVVAAVTSSVRGGRISEKQRTKAKQTKQSIEYANRNAISSAEGEAQGITFHLSKTHESSSALASELPQHLNSAADWLRHAEKEFRDNAFGPFWDAVENAAQHLAEFDGKAKQLCRAHTFPSFPLNDANLPSPSSVVSELRRVVRMGRTTFSLPIYGGIQGL